MLDSSPIDYKSMDLCKSSHELRPCMESLNNGEAIFMMLEVRRNHDDKGSPPLFFGLLNDGGLLLGETLNEIGGSK
jgi:hypothetical protein